ncbi:RhoGAP domain-containing protein [Serratia marcescens]|uniref:RhoGAP domain-containing protein n=1 Tax=Serratia marcescens TaxID=615 RepID=UPI00148B47B1|nr:RhoGAP domain-containing protein [Serratia marcescens]QJU42301.1 hypothetical protein HMI62_24655 [Serratia marcescens]
MFKIYEKATRIRGVQYYKWEGADLHSDNRAAGDELRSIKNDNRPVLERDSHRSGKNAFLGRMAKLFKKIRYFGRYDSKGFTFSSTRAKDVERHSFQSEKIIEDKQISLKILVDYLRKNKSLITTEGLFRVAANYRDQNNFIKEMNKINQPWIISQKVDTNIICNTIKILIEQSLTSAEFSNFSSFQNTFSESGRLPSIITLPEAFRIIQPLMKDVLANVAYNKMTAENLAIVIAPRFFSAEESLNTTGNNAFLEALLLEYCMD